ncbi:MAG: hypothetical protein LC687_01035, partial [Actinobacteria bacterium]|nr:hypothetical protein [Actinomycetota bacterium]
EVIAQPTVGGGKFGGVPIAPDLTDIEEVYLTALGGEKGVTVNADKSSGVEEWWNVGSATDLAIINIQQIEVNPTVTIGMDGTDVGADFFVTFDANALPADATIGESYPDGDVVNVVLNNVGKGDLGGTLSIGSNVVSSEEEKRGVEEFNVSVGPLSSWLESLETTGDRLSKVTIDDEAGATVETILQIGSGEDEPEEYVPTSSIQLGVAPPHMGIPDPEKGVFQDLTTFDAEGFVGQLGRFSEDSDVDLTPVNNFWGPDFPEPNTSENPIRFMFNEDPATASTFTGTADILGGEGGNRLHVDLENESSVDLTLNGGTGRDKLTVQGVTLDQYGAATLTYNVSTAANSGNRDISITTDTPNAAGDDKVVIEDSSADGDIEVSLGGGFNTLDIDGSSTGLDLILSGSGNNDIDIDDSTVGDDLLVDTGSAGDDLTVNSTDVGKDVDIDAGEGKNTILFNAEGSDSSKVAGDFFVDTGDDNDDITLNRLEIGTADGIGPDVDDGGPTDGGDLVINAGNGFNDVTLNAITMLGSSIDIDTGSGQDDVLLTNVTSPGPVTINTGGNSTGTDSVTINGGQFSNGPDTNTVDIDTGEGVAYVGLFGDGHASDPARGEYDFLSIDTGDDEDNDVVEIDDIRVNESVDIDTGAGDDTIEYRNTDPSVLDADGGDGFDTFRINQDIATDGTDTPTRFTNIERLVLERPKINDIAVDMELLNAVADDDESIVQEVWVEPTGTGDQTSTIDNLRTDLDQSVVISNLGLLPAPGFLTPWTTVNGDVGDVTISTQIDDEADNRTLEVELLANNNGSANTPSVNAVGDLTITDNSIGIASVEVVSLTSEGGEGDRNVVQNFVADEAELLRIVGTNDLSLHIGEDGLYSSDGAVNVLADTLEADLQLVLNGEDLSTGTDANDPVGDRLFANAGQTNLLALYGTLAVTTGAAAGETDIQGFQTIEFGTSENGSDQYDVMSIDSGLGIDDSFGAKGDFDAAGLSDTPPEYDIVNTDGVLSLTNLESTVRINASDTEDYDSGTDGEYFGADVGDIFLDANGGSDDTLDLSIYRNAGPNDWDDGTIDVIVTDFETVNLMMPTDDATDWDFNLHLDGDARELYITGERTTPDAQGGANGDLDLGAALPATLDTIDVSDYEGTFTAFMTQLDNGTDVDVIVGDDDIFFTMADNFTSGGGGGATVADDDDFTITFTGSSANNPASRELTIEYNDGSPQTLSVGQGGGTSPADNTAEAHATYFAGLINGVNGVSASASGADLTITNETGSSVDINNILIGGGDTGSLGFTTDLGGGTSSTTTASDYNTIFKFTDEDIVDGGDGDPSSVWTIDNFLVAGVSPGTTINNFTRLDISELSGVDDLTDLQVVEDNGNAVISSEQLGAESWQIVLTDKGGIADENILNTDTFIL